MVFDPRSWPQIRLVVFDLDGTLYRQRPVRLRMAAALARHGLTGGWRDVRVVSQFRSLRESDDAAASADFEDWCLAETARRTGLPVAGVAALVQEWIDTRPLPLLRPARYPHVDRLFAALQSSGRRVAVWSDHRVDAKLAALELPADDRIAATDPDVRRLKPDPTGLRLAMARAGVGPDATLMIGDRADRDGEAARRAGTHVAIRTSRPAPGYTSFAAYDDAIFAPVLR